jgi:hypothetical protein
MIRSKLPRLFRIRFSLRTLFAAMFILSIALGFIGNFFYRICHERWIVLELAKHDGRCDFDYEFAIADGSYCNTNYPDSIHAPAWLRRIFGDEALGRVAAINFPYGNVDDANLKLLTELPYLEAIDLSSTNVTDAGLIQIANCRSLRYLRLFPSRFTDDGFKALSSLSKLEVLELHVPIHDDVLKDLASLQNLVSLQIDSDNLTDEALFYVGKLQKLQRLSLEGKGFRGRGLVHLRSLASLQYLQLSGWILDEGSADHLSELQNLERFFLTLRSIPDADVAKLAKLSSLKWLALPSDVSSSSVLALRESLPDCHISGGASTDSRKSEQVVK